MYPQSAKSMSNIGKFSYYVVHVMDNAQNNVEILEKRK